MSKFWLWIKIIGAALLSRSNQTFYDRISPIYNKVFSDHVIHAKKIMESLNDVYPDQKHEMLVLDLGCGTGILGSMLTDKGYQVIGLDISYKSLCELRKRQPQLGIIQADANDLPISKATFHAVVCLGVWRHFPDYQKVLKEVARILTTDGVFIVGYFPPNIAGAIPVNQNALGRLLVWLYQIFTKKLGYQDQVDFSLEEKTEAAARERFKEVSTIASGVDKRLLLAQNPR
jgi:ubiquinone/menaquinone biosynthesis C-methylase UbiE